MVQIYRDDIHGAVACREKLGGPGRVVVVDETYLTSRKRNRGNFRGRPTLGHKTCIMGLVEWDSLEQGRKETGRKHLVIIDLWMDGDDNFTHHFQI